VHSRLPTLFLLLVLGVPARAGDAVGGNELGITEAERFYDGLADSTKRSVFEQVAGACDPTRDGTLRHALEPPKRFGVLRLYPRGYHMARRVTALPLNDQQRIYAYVYDHQVRSGWVRRPAEAATQPAQEPATALP
jgi:hypothetical protein